MNRRSEKVPGLDLEREGRFLTFRYAQHWEVFFLAGGAAYRIASPLHGRFPAHVRSYVDQTLRAYLQAFEGQVA